MKTFIFILTVSLAAGISACKKDKDPVKDPQPIDNEPEVITTVKLTFVDSADASNIRTAVFRDPDGDGGAAYDIFDTIRLQSNKTWYTQLVLLNETVSPADTISNEVLEEGVDHLFCFTPSGISIVVTKTDTDANGLPIGLQSKWLTFSGGLGSMQVVLRHQPGIKTGDCALGDTDVEINFPVKIQ